MIPTVEQILAEPAGDRLNHWIAIHALGCTVTFGEVWVDGHRVDQTRAVLVRPDGEVEHLPRWSDDDRLALGLVVELDATKFWLKQRKSAMIRQHWLQIIPDTRATSFTWIASFGDQPHEVTGETRAIAICRAALLWKLYPGG